MIKTLNEVKEATEQELLNCVKEAAGYKGKEFQKEFETNYSYSSLTAELTKRGAVNGWYFPSWYSPSGATLNKEIEVQTGVTRTRSYIPVNESCAETFNRFLNCLEEDGALTHGMKYVYYTAALTHFMDDYVNGKITIKTIAPKAQASMEKLREIVSSEGQEKPKTKTKKSE